MKTAVCINIVVFLFSLTNTNARETLRIGVYIDLTGFLPAMELALKTIEDDITLPFTFNVTLNDSMVSSITRSRRSLCQYKLPWTFNYTSSDELAV